jgi:hypothetical protein
VHQHGRNLGLLGIDNAGALAAVRVGRREGRAGREAVVGTGAELGIQRGNARLVVQNVLAVLTALLRRQVRQSEDQARLEDKEEDRQPQRQARSDVLAKEEADEDQHGEQEHQGVEGHGTNVRVTSRDHLHRLAALRFGPGARAAERRRARAAVHVPNTEALDVSLGQGRQGEDHARRPQNEQTKQEGDHPNAQYDHLFEVQPQSRRLTQGRGRPRAHQEAQLTTLLCETDRPPVQNASTGQAILLARQEQWLSTHADDRKAYCVDAKVEWSDMFQQRDPKNRVAL